MVDAIGCEQAGIVAEHIVGKVKGGLNACWCHSGFSSGACCVDGLPGLVGLALHAGGRGVWCLEAQFNQGDGFGEKSAALGGWSEGKQEGVEASLF